MTFVSITGDANKPAPYIAIAANKSAVKTAQHLSVESTDTTAKRGSQLLDVNEVKTNDIRIRNGLQHSKSVIGGGKVSRHSPMFNSQSPKIQSSLSAIHETENGHLAPPPEDKRKTYESDRFSFKVTPSLLSEPRSSYEGRPSLDNRSSVITQNNLQATAIEVNKKTQHEVTIVESSPSSSPSTPSTPASVEPESDETDVNEGLSFTLETRALGQALKERLKAQNRASTASINASSTAPPTSPTKTTPTASSLTLGLTDGISRAPTTIIQSNITPSRIGKGAKSESINWSEKLGTVVKQVNAFCNASIQWLKNTFSKINLALTNTGAAPNHTPSIEEEDSDDETAERNSRQSDKDIEADRRPEDLGTHPAFRATENFLKVEIPHEDFFNELSTALNNSGGIKDTFPTIRENFFDDFFKS